MGGDLVSFCSTVVFEADDAILTCGPRCLIK